MAFGRARGAGGVLTVSVKADPPCVGLDEGVGAGVLKADLKIKTIKMILSKHKNNFWRVKDEV